MTRLRRPAVLRQLTDPHVVIEASAGTGKTYTLEHLVVDLILQGIPLPEILIVTFTTKATLELRERVRKILQKLLAGEMDIAGAEEEAWEYDELAEGRVQAALGALDQATISTIHGFCQKVLKEAALESRALFTREQADGRALFQRAFEACLRTSFTSEPRLQSLLQTALSEGRTVEALGGDLYEASRERARIFPELGALPAHLLALPGLPEAEAQALLAAGKAAGTHWKTLEAAPAQLDAVRALTEVTGDPLAFVQRWSSLTTTSLQKVCAEVGDALPFAAWVNRFVAFGASPEALLVEGLLPEVQQRLAAIKADEGCFDFDDMILEVKRALEGPEGAGLISRLRATYRVALIDEFQDTDTAQWEIFRTLFRVASHKLTLIGDPKQAIYGFRGGDLPTYQRASAEVSQGREVVRLTANHRSTEPLIHGYNHILEGFFTGANAYPAPVTCGRPGLRHTSAGGAEVKPITVLSVPVPARRGNRRLWRQLAHALAGELADYMASGPRFGEGEDAKPLSWKDVYILTGKGKEGQLVAEALGARGIPHAFFKQEGLFQTQEAEAWQAVLRAISEPWDSARLAQALLTPFFGFTIPELEGLRDLGETHPVRERLRSWGLLAQDRRFPAMIEAVLRESGILRRLLLMEGGARSLTNVQHLAELLAQQALDSHGDLEDLLRQLGHWREGTALPAGENGNVQRLEGREDAVQIMTMHASKGLEAPVVALFAFGKGRVGGDFHRFTLNGERCLWIGPRPDDKVPELARIREAIEAAEEEEAQRVNYVALTRAKAKLFLPCLWMPGAAATSPKGKAKPEEPLTRDVSRTIQCLNARLFQLVRSGAPLHAAFDVRDFHGGVLPEPEAPKPRNLADWAPPTPASHPESDLAGLRRSARGRATFSFTGLQKRLERDYRAPEREDLEPDDLPAVRPPEALPSGKEMGVLLHGLLEEVDFASLPGETFEAWWKAQGTFRAITEDRLRLAGVELRWATAVARLVHQALTTPFPWIRVGSRAVAEATHSLRELDFLTAAPGTPEFLEGSLDALLEFEGRAFILDWKSNTLPAYDPATLAENVRTHYDLQVRIYTLATLRFLGIETEAGYEARFGGVAYVYLRGLPEGGFWHTRPSWADVQAWRLALSQLVTEVALG